MALSPQRPEPTPEAIPAAGPGVPVLVVTTDDDLWMRLTAAIPGLRLEQHDSVPDLVEQWPSSRPAVVLVDARHDGDLARTVERLQTHSVTLVPVACVDAAHLPAATALERQRALFAHVSDTLEPAATLAVLERAGEESQARAAVVPPGVTHAVAPNEPSPPSGPSRVAIVGGALALLALAGVAWWYAHSTPPTPKGPASAATGAPSPAAAPAPTADAAATAEQIEVLLERARVAMRDKRYIDPESDNALAHYRAVLAFDPENGEARQGLDRVAEVLIGRAEAAMGNRDYPAALRALEFARTLKPDHPRLAALDAQVGQRLGELSLAQIQAAIAANSFDRANTLLRQAEKTGAVPAATLAQLRADIGRRQSRNELSELQRLAEARIAQGRLLEPAGDSARHYLDQLQGRPDAADTAARVRQDYARRVVTEARSAAARGAQAEFEQWLGELRATGAPASQVAALQKEAAQALQAQASPKAPDAQHLAQLVNERIAQRRLTGTDSDNAAGYLRLLQAADPRGAALPGLRDALATALLDQARTSAESGRALEAQAALDAAREFGATAAQLAAAQPAPSVARGGGASAPRLQKALAPVYPDRARLEGRSGWVDVEFTVDARGIPQDVRVTASEPAGTFDSAALSAVRRARFDPARTPDGTAVPAASRLRVRFALSN
jgi:protein TonB